MTTEAQVVQVRTLDWKEMVMRSWGKDWTKPDPAYEFTNRTFEDPKDGGPYDQD
jgi:hypothetical protein